MERIIELIIDEENEFSGIEAISVVENPAIEEDFIALKKQPIQLAEVDSEKRILMGPALIPDRKILRKDDDGEYYIYFSKETVRKASEPFLMKGNQNNSTLEHQDVLKGMSVVESWIIEDKNKDKSKKYKMDLPLNTWMISVKVLNDEIWNQVKEGEIKGFSIEGYFADKAERPKESIKEKFKSMVINEDFAIIEDRLAYSSIDKAIEISKELGCIGYHEHEYEGNTWYMPCEKHIVENEAETVLKKLLSELENIKEEERIISLEKTELSEKKYSYPDAVKNNAKRALSFKKNNPHSSCGTKSGWEAAKLLASGEPVSRWFIAHMASYVRFKRDKNQKYGEGCGKLLWDAWGGDAGILTFAPKALKEINREPLDLK